MLCMGHKIIILLSYLYLKTSVRSKNENNWGNAKALAALKINRDLTKGKKMSKY